MKITVVYHSADYDGIFCREIARKFLGDENVDFVGWTFGNPKIDFPKEGYVYIMDLPVSEPFKTFSWSEGKPRIIWIDHHKTSISNAPSGIAGYQLEGVAACRLAWQWFTAYNVPTSHQRLPTVTEFVHRLVDEPWAVTLAGEYDVWDHRADGDLEFQFGLDSLAHIDWHLLFSEKLSDPVSKGPSYIDGIITNGAAAMACYAKRDADIVRERSFIVEFEGLKFLTLNTAKCNSNTFKDKDFPDTGHDALMAFYYNGRVWVFSLYHAKHKKNIDLSAIAKKLGGGGHPGACGFQCDKIPFICDK